MTKKEKDAATLHAVHVARFVLWARDLGNVDGLPLVTAEVRAWCEAAAEELVYQFEQMGARRKTAQEKGRLGGRPKKQSPI